MGRVRPPASHRVNWLRFGTFALVETSPFNRKLVRRGDVTDLSNPNWWKDYYARGSWIVFPKTETQKQEKEKEKKKGEKWETLKANYVVFSIIPGQLREDDETLRASDRLSEAFLRQVRSGMEDPGEAADEVCA